ncbi:MULTISPECIES: DUF1007 family protein [Alphaproteobacteria]|uniref:ABC transporter substrate-binding protein n=2 Tax=Alphaproteobacteria TaxID=28211 RepID=A0A512HJ10_9HYPH|nr:MULTISPECIES: DUF1007 family protein [Alphaproteobacteria]GEO85422.1 ABC transporter substrate-binding protein [Ciceribacter naphthalenivorans]GLR21556.1 ABC transporter substrate-binding protein [Ciceribacter naphthalenivorans]GLT04412.1 ABC transporter substrate-binding protein [Sphingomonas psychrolutea]
MKIRLALIMALVGVPLPAFAHPHIFAEARLEIIAGADGTISELRNVWRFDDVFSSSVLMDFDKNSDLKLDHSELNEIAKTISTSLADYGFFTSITSNGAAVAVDKPDVFNVDFKDNQLLVFFIAKPEKTLPLKGKLSIGVYDPTMYTAIDFEKDEDITTEGDGFKACKRAVIRPDPDTVLAQNQANLTEAFFNDPAGTDMSRLFATRLELTC